MQGIVLAPIVQRIEQRSSKASMLVRFQLGAPASANSSDRDAPAQLSRILMRRFDSYRLDQIGNRTRIVILIDHHLQLNPL